eukprot:gene20787-33662_t
MSGDFELSATLAFWGAGAPACVDAATNVSVSNKDAGRVVDGRGRVELATLGTHREREAVACVTEDGALLLLSAWDGSFLAAAPRLLHQAISACALPPVFGASLLAVCGAHCQLSVVDTDALSVVCSAEVPPPGFTSALAAEELPTRPGDPPAAMLVTVMGDRELRYWTVYGGDAVAVQQRRTVPLPQRGVPMGVHIHPELHLVLVVVSDGWA